MEVDLGVKPRPVGQPAFKQFDAGLPQAAGGNGEGQEQHRVPAKIIRPNIRVNGTGFFPFFRTDEGWKERVPTSTGE